MKNKLNKNTLSENLTKQEDNNRPILNELKRIVNYYKNRYDILIIVIIITLLINDFIFTKYNKKYTSKNKTIILKGGGNLSKYLLNTSILDNLKQQFPLDNNHKFNYIIVGFGYFILAFVVRPIRAFFIFILIIFAISGSFIFPFLFFGILLYFVLKKIITNNKPSIEL